MDKPAEQLTRNAQMRVQSREVHILKAYIRIVSYLAILHSLQIRERCPLCLHSCISALVNEHAERAGGERAPAAPPSACTRRCSWAQCRTRAARWPRMRVGQANVECAHRAACSVPQWSTGCHPPPASPTCITPLVQLRGTTSVPYNCYTQRGTTISTTSSASRAAWHSHESYSYRQGHYQKFLPTVHCT